MKEKLLFIGTLAMCVLYYIEVIPGGNYDAFNIAGFAISAIVIVPWLISMLFKLKNKREEKELKNIKKEQKEKK